MPTANRTPEQAARDNIDSMLSQAGWAIQDKKKIDFSAASGIAVREYPTDAGPADYALFVDRKPVGVVEAKPESWGQENHHGRGTVRALRGGRASSGSRTGYPCPSSMKAPAR